ncbi:hypothetical protein RN001_010496 [Aquatica leii]|uniref:Major facilitator superfamily (MFS) profile domain-containing protein n=1 Tax=Aquatica leii TaxID=1421715 RepID=A0AAN7P110_9COLE|nr:hypothetical protein RN001_010496 [Aquatica leii]
MPTSEESKFSSFRNVVISCRSLSHYESKRFKTLLPQILATFIVMCINILVGFTYGYSAIFIPQIMQTQNSTEPDVIPVTTTAIAWIISCPMLITPIGAISGGFIMDAIGRLNTVKIMAIPSIIGWSLLALATNVPMLIIGRLFTGIAMEWAANPAAVYITEISRPDVRGSFTSSCSLGVSIGIILVYVQGWYLDWRIVAWICVGYTIVSTVFIFFLPESPTWLISKNRTQNAKKSLEFFYKYQPQPENKNSSFAEMQLAVLVRENAIKERERQELSKNGAMQMLKTFGQPIGYKPIFITMGLYFFQQFSGIHVILFNGVIFVKEMGTTIDPYLATIYIGVMRLVMTIVNMALMKRFRRRTLLMISGVGMALFMSISGMYTKWLQEGSTTKTWIPLTALMFYFVFAIGFMVIPFAIQAEVFPLVIRGVAHAIVSSLANFIVFCALQAYFPTKDFFGGSYGIQFFYGVMALGGALFVFVFMPETHNKKLSEIEAYFWKHTTYLSVSQEEDDADLKKVKVLASVK